MGVAFVGMTVKLWMLQLSPEQHSMLQSSKVMFWNARVVLNFAQDASLSKEKKFTMNCVQGIASLSLSYLLTPQQTKGSMQYYYQEV